MSLDWVDKHGRKSFRPHGRQFRNQKEYNETFYKYGDKRDLAKHPLSSFSGGSGPESIQRDFERTDIHRSPDWFGTSIYAVDKTKARGRKYSTDFHDTRLQDGAFGREGYDTQTVKTEQEDIGAYSPDVGKITYPKGFVDSKGRKGEDLPKRTIYWSPEATRVRSESTRDRRYLKNVKNEKQRKELIGLLEGQGL